MKNTTILALTLAGLASATAFAQDTAAPGDLLESINMFTPEEGDPAYKVAANEKYGTQWYVDLAYGYWHAKNTRSDYNNNAHMALVHAVLNQRIIEDNVNGGTWIRAEFSGSWGLDHRSSRSDTQFADAFATATFPHFDVYGPNDGVIPELSIMHYFAGKRACIIAGMVNLTNYIDCVGIANDTFCSFVNGGFVNSTVLALPDANAGAVLQAELTPASYAMVAFSRETTSYGHNPFSSSGRSYLLVGEYGHHILDGDATLRFNPFYRHVETEEGYRSNFGLAASIEYTVCDELTVFARTGLAAHQQFGCAFDFSCGANIKLIPSREDDFLGLAVGVFKGENSTELPTVHRREFVAEAMYSFQVNDYFKLVPHIQYISNPAYDEESSFELITGIQAVLSF